MKVLVITCLIINLFDLLTRIGAILNGLNGTSSGWQVYPGGSYHYGPSIFIDANEDNLIHMWTCSPGTGSTQWDVIRYYYSNDNGRTWSPDEIALKPTSGSLDAYSACDPGVVKIDKYYYIGYTSTINPNATQNQLFLARSLIPNGNYEKWNGTGWNSNNPQPIVAYHGPSSKYGIGEPSLVLKDNLIYVYYTNADNTGSFTDLAIAQLNLQYKGHVIKMTTSHLRT